MEQFIQNYRRTLPLRKYFLYVTAQKYQTPWSVFQDGSKDNNSAPDAKNQIDK